MLGKYHVELTKESLRAFFTLPYWGQAAFARFHGTAVCALNTRPAGMIPIFLESCHSRNAGAEIEE